MLILMSCMAVKPPVIVDARPTVTYIPYTIKWVLKGSEANILDYKVQRSTNNRTWKTIGNPVYPTHLPDSNVYRVQLPKTPTSYFYKIVVDFKKGSPFSSIAAHISNTNAK